MAFPTISDTVITDNTAGLIVDHPVEVPGPLNIGSLLVAFWWTSRNGFNTQALYNWPAGWSLLCEAAFNNKMGVHVFKYRPALLPVLGVERGERTTHPGETFYVTTSPLAQTSIICMMLIAPDDIPTEYVLGAGVISGGPANPDPPNLVYSTTPKDVLWLTGCMPLGSWGLSTYPANYTLYQQDFGNYGAMAGRELNATSENPGVFTPASPSDHGAVTVGIAFGDPGGPNGPIQLTAPVDPNSAIVSAPERIGISDEVFIEWIADRGFDDDSVGIDDDVTPVES